MVLRLIPKGAHGSVDRNRGQWFAWFEGQLKLTQQIGITPLTKDLAIATRLKLSDKTFIGLIDTIGAARQQP